MCSLRTHCTRTRCHEHGCPRRVSFWTPVFATGPLLIMTSVIRPLGSTTYVDAACSYRPSSVVCRSVCHTSEPCKNGCTEGAAVWVEDSGGPREPCIRWGSRSPHGNGNFEGKWASDCKVKGHSAVICAKTAEPIEMPFELWAWMDGRNHVLHEGPAVLRDVAMAIIFWLSIYGCTLAPPGEYE